MAQSTQAVELIDAISQRSDLISYLLENDKPVSKQTISNDLGLARSTVDKVTRNLLEEGLLESTANGHVPTLFAVLVWDAYESFAQSIAEITTSEDDTTPMWPTETERQEVMQLVAARLDVLECTRMPHDKRDLVDDLAVSRSTVDRAIRGLEVVGLVAWTTDGYVTTAPARRAIDQYRATVEVVADILAAREVLAVLSPDSPLQPALLTDSIVEFAADTPPYHLPQGVRDRIVAADRVCLYLPALATPQLLDCCQQQVIHEGLTLDLLTGSSLYQTLSAEFPGPLSSIAGSDCTVLVADTPPDNRLPFGLLLAETEGNTTVSVITYGEQRTIHGTIHNSSAAAVQWAKKWYESVYVGATDVTDELRALGPAGRTTPMGDSERLALESEGFVRLTPAYFSQRAPASPVTGWRTGFDLVDVHAGYAIDRETERDETRCNFTDVLTERLTAGTNLALLGSPGSGKSTACKSVACRWYEQGRGAVFYRESGRGTTVPPSTVLSGHLRETDGHALVVVEDAVRAEANAVFRLMRAFRGTDTVTFLLDAREDEWNDPERLPIDAGLEAYRHEDIETIPIPTFDDTEAERLVGQFEQTTGRDLDSTLVSHLWEDGTTATEGHEKHTPMSNIPGALLLFLHRLVLAVEPLAVYDANTPTSLVEDVQRTYEDLRQAGEPALDVGVFVNLLNAAGIGVSPDLVCALATDGDREGFGIDDVRTALSSLEGQVIFPHEENGQSSYRTVHEQWSVLFLEHLIDASETERTAHRRVGRCITALLSLADDESQRSRIRSAFVGTVPAIERIAAAPDEWADTTVERLFGLGRTRRGLTPLFGTTGDSWIDLPAVCSSSVIVDCTRWRALMAKEAGNFDRATHEYEALEELATEVAATEPDRAARLHGQRLNGLGKIAWSQSDLDTAETYFTRALEYHGEADDTRRLADTRMNLAGLAYGRGDLETAEQQCRQTLETYRELGDVRGKAKSQYNLGIIIDLTGDLETVVTHIQQCLELDRQRDERRDEALHLSSLGIAVARQGDLDTGETYCVQAFELAHELGTSDREAKSLRDLGEISRLRGDLDAAATYYRQSLAISQENGDRRYQADCRLSLGLIACDRGALDTATEHCTAGLTTCRELEARIGEADSLAALGRIEYRSGSLCTAKEHTTDALNVYQETGHSPGATTCHRLLGQIACDHERFPAAEEHLRQALTDFHERGDRFEEAKSLVALGHLNRERESIKRARENLTTAVDVYSDIGAVRDTIEASEQLVAVCETLGDPDAALTHCKRVCDLARETEFIESSATFEKRRDRLVEQLASGDSA